MRVLIGLLIVYALATWSLIGYVSTVEDNITKLRQIIALMETSRKLQEGILLETENKLSLYDSCLKEEKTLSEARECVATGKRLK